MVAENQQFVLHARIPFALFKVLEDKLEVVWSESELPEGLLRRAEDWYKATQNDKKI